MGKYNTERKYKEGQETYKAVHHFILKYYRRHRYMPSTRNIADGMRLGYYSTKAKAMKVLDMIQKAYADFEASKITSTGLVIATYTGSCDTPESAACGIKALKGYVEMIRESVVFQIPADSEVEI